MFDGLTLGVVLILWVRMNASVTQDALVILSSDANAHPSLQSTPVRERGAEQMHNVDLEVVKGNASVQKNSPMEILMSDVQRQISVSSIYFLVFYVNNIKFKKALI